ncbi:MAG: SoxR reducing system RseC family protein [Cellvibrionaceae bacterium]
MIKEAGRIVAVDTDAVWVETIQKSTCGSCVAQKGCGQSLLSRIGIQPSYIRVLLEGRSPDNYKVNDNIVLGIPDDIVVKASIFIYLLPLILILVFAGVAHTYFVQESTVVLSGLIGFILGGFIVRLHSNYYRNDKRYQPIIVSADIVEPKPIDLKIKELINN